MISSLRLQNFRSYSDDSFEFEPGVTIIVGPNASGKTNLLEAILVAAQGHSYRVSDEDLITFQKPWARLDVSSQDGSQRTVKLDRTAGRLVKSYVIDEKPFKILSHTHTLPVVLFEPNHLQLLHGSPDNRRTYLDDLLSQIRPGFTTMRAHYRRALSQRNALLKHGYDRAQGQVFAWNLRLSDLGGHIAAARMELVAEIAAKATNLYKDLSHTTTDVQFTYQTRLPAETYATSLLRKLEDSLQQDCERGFTAYGPHRDDMVILFDGVPASETASRGETRTALLALKVVELQLLEQHRGIKPLLLLDDVFSELDGARRIALTSYLKDYQTFITTTDADLAIELLGKHTSTIALNKTPPSS